MAPDSKMLFLNFQPEKRNYFELETV